MGVITTKGEGPIMDLVVVKDYGVDAKGTVQLRTFLRLHNDVLIDDTDAPVIEKKLAAGDFKGVYNTLFKTFEKDDAWGPVLATWRAALRQ